MTRKQTTEQLELNRRSLMKATAGAAAGAALVGSVTTLSVQSTGAQDAGTALQMGRETEFAPIFVPFHASNGTQTQIFDLIYSRLLKVQDDLTFQPDLAESWEVNEDATVYTFKIREGITWTDGEPFTIDDIIFTYTTALTPETGAAQAGKLKQIKGATAFYDGESDTIEGLERVDDTTLRITLELPNVAFLTGTAGSSSLVWILPEHIFSSVDLATIDQAPESQSPTVGTGAYQWVEYVPDQYISFTANPNYHLGAPKIQQVFLRLAEPATQLAQLESGELHLVSRMAAKEADRLSTSETIDIVNTPGVGVFQTAIFNERVPDKRVRQAMMYGTDRKALLDAVLLGQGELVYSTVIGPDWAVYDDLNTYEFDPEKARSLLEEAGWDGSQTLELTWSKGYQPVELAAPVFQQQMADIGITIELAPLESAAYVDKVVIESGLRSGLVWWRFVPAGPGRLGQLLHDGQLDPEWWQHNALFQRRAGPALHRWTRHDRHSDPHGDLPRGGQNLERRRTHALLVVGQSNLRHQQEAPGRQAWSESVHLVEHPGLELRRIACQEGSAQSSADPSLVFLSGHIWNVDGSLLHSPAGHIGTGPALRHPDCVRACQSRARRSGDRHDQSRYTS